MGSPVLPKPKETQAELGSAYVGLGDPRANNHIYIVPLTFPLIIGPDWWKLNGV